MALRTVRTRLENALNTKTGQLVLILVISLVFLHQYFIYVDGANFANSNNKSLLKSRENNEDVKEIVKKDPNLDFQCQCKEISPSIPKNKSVCSDYSVNRGPGQKIISYSYYNGHDLAGIEKNLEAISELYPGYVMRVYHNNTRSDNDLCGLFCTNDNLDICDITNSGKIRNK
jgi:hypothetical protein